ncbi:MAG: LysR family transcriptional regulator [Neomegalonema sp.]|nr:LysR family transcriptional regulator [Neomegalonema sp.]
MDEFASLTTFITVVETGGFSAAARQLGVTPSAVSRQIAQIEADLGARLFHRTTRKQSLTEAGELLLVYARRICADVETAREVVAGLSQAPSGTLHVTVEPELANLLIAPLLPDFLARYPKVRLHLSMSANLVDLVEGRMDLAIRMGHLDDSSLVARRIALSRSRLYASPAYLAEHGVPDHPSALAAHACLSFRLASGPILWRFGSQEGPLELELTGPLRANSLTLLLSMALAGQGIVMIPSWVADKAEREGRLVSLLAEFPILPSATPISAVFPNPRHLAPKVRAFIDHLAAHMDLGEGRAASSEEDQARMHGSG